MPLTIHIPPRTGPLAPMTSTDGETWTPLQPLFSGTLPEGRARAATPATRRLARHRDDEQRLLRTASRGARPPAPAELTGPLLPRAARALVAKSTGPSGAAVFYQVTLTTTAARDPGPDDGRRRRRCTTRPERLPRDRDRRRREEERALQAARRHAHSKRPSKLPKIIPEWAFDSVRTGSRAGSGTRPNAPRIVPDWYWRW